MMTAQSYELHLAASAEEESDRLLELVVLERVQLTEDIVLFMLGDPAGADLPPFTPGAHIAVTTPCGLVRKYSLCNGPEERQSYTIAVKREREGFGGSRSMTDDVKVGARLKIAAPRNDFPLDETAARVIFVAGGIGITPIFSMMKHLEVRGRPYKLYYATRTEHGTAFRNELKPFQARGDVMHHHDEGNPARALDVKGLFADWPQGAHLYCCGPRPLMEAVRAATANWPRGTVHFEDFGVRQAHDHEGDRPFRVRLARSGITVEVPANMTIIEALRAKGVEVESSCEAGTCGTCRVRLLEGQADHRDLVLFDDEMDEFIMICISRSKSPELVLDL